MVSNPALIWGAVSDDTGNQGARALVDGTDDCAAYWVRILLLTFTIFFSLEIFKFFGASGTVCYGTPISSTGAETIDTAIKIRRGKHENSLVGRLLG